jgi:ATP-dependent helicase IRC3
MFMSLIPRVRHKHRLGEGETTDSLDLDRSGQTMIVVSSVELASQAEAAAKRLLWEGWTVEVEQGKRRGSGFADVYVPRVENALIARTIATWQTLNNVDRLRKYDPSRFKLVIVDEAHHAAAISYAAPTTSP